MRKAVCVGEELPVSLTGCSVLFSCGHAFRQYLDRNPTWQTLKQKNPELTPYCLRHGYAYRGALAGIPLRQLAASMGHDVSTHMKYYGQWTDEAGLDGAFGAANARLIAEVN